MGDQADVIERFSVKTFKSLEEVTVELGQVNVFVGANGIGKSNLLEALGVLSAAANGKQEVIFCQQFTVWLYSVIRMRKSGRFAKIFWISLIGPRRLN
ncbi:MAG: AAA family ATPase [Cyanobacteria bacterium MAG IRC4_bin_6]|nr:AAA family ATPase [Cyanobacteria bacterium MAG IRC4_bin_6]